MKTKLILFLIIPFFYSCIIETLPDEELTMTRTPYNGKEIRLDGCYVSDADEQKKYCEYDFFYSSGVLFVDGDLLNIKNINQFTGGLDYSRKSHWGVFQVENDTIKAQKWRMNDTSIQFIIQNRYYKIINDTTLAIDLLQDGDIRYYHFMKFNPKPDSINIFIK